MFYITQSYYSPVTDTVEEVFLYNYSPLGWIGIVLCGFNLMLTALKVFDIIGNKSEV